MRIAIVHDYFTQMGGAEKVVEELVRMLPNADLHATVALPELMPESLAGRQVGTTWMQHMPLDEGVLSALLHAVSSCRAFARSIGLRPGDLQFFWLCQGRSHWP